jgi:hypothetical protein
VKKLATIITIATGIVIALTSLLTNLSKLTESARELHREFLQGPSSQPSPVANEKNLQEASPQQQGEEAQVPFAATTSEHSAWILAAPGCLVWDDGYRPDETVNWRGACENGFASGYGTELWFKKEGTEDFRYEGTLVKGKAEGRGVVTLANGDRYDGELKDGIENGHGVYTWASRAHYDGEWKDGNKTGHGVMTWLTATATKAIGRTTALMELVLMSGLTTERLLASGQTAASERGAIGRP